MIYVLEVDGSALDKDEHGIKVGKMIYVLEVVGTALKLVKWYKYWN